MKSCESNVDGERCRRDGTHHLLRGHHMSGPESFVMCPKHATEAIGEGCELEDVEGDS